MSTVTASETPPRALAIGAGGFMTEAIGGIATAALAILALVGVQPASFTAIAGIVFGAALLIEGAAMSTEYSQLASKIARTRTEAIEISGGFGVEVLVGLASVALGILALVGVSPAVLIPALLITGGTGLLLSSGSTAQMNDLRLVAAGHDDTTRRIVHGAVTGSALAQTLGGIAVIVLGILSLVAVPSFAAAGYGSLPQIGMLVLGVTLALTGGALTGKMARMHSGA